MTDNDIGKNSLNFGHDPDHDPEEILSVSIAYLLVMKPLADVYGPLRSFGRNQTEIYRLTSVSCKKCGDAERRIASVAYNFNIFCGVCAL